MQGNLVRRKLSVRLSVKREDCDKTEEKSVQSSKNMGKPAGPESTV